ncbi:aquaporin AQPAe.a-like [Limulus polyphemus]|uniref:Aquaporin AQPAe.a-like n=1 Tax=Limulus polyphemus TaxID=6850 RepID=A0ABM1BAT9_LIMPO|nr:aquaporin AQPAe.a-like [Limulus polyphemus]
MGRVRKFRAVCGIDELSNENMLWKALLAEFIGTGILVLIGCGSCISGWDEDYKPSVVQIALAFGVTVGTIVQAMCHISGGHINPAVTLAFLATGKCSILRAFFYVCAQCVGAITGAAVLKALTPLAQQELLGATTVHPHLNPIQGCIVEICITFVLVLTVFSVCDGNRLDVRGSAPLAIGLSVATCHMFAVKYTGSSMNTARSFGPAVIAGVWEYHWIYWLGPILGGIIAGIFYQHTFSALPPEPEELERVRLNSIRRYEEKEVIEDRTSSV